MLDGRTVDNGLIPCAALEILTHPEKRRQYDSVDRYYMDMEDEVPTASDIRKENDFFKLFAPIFEREARFSRKQPVPPLGAADATKEEVEGFYDFWYNFDSWRSFEYLDKEVNEGSDRFVTFLPRPRPPPFPSRLLT